MSKRDELINNIYSVARRDADDRLAVNYLDVEYWADKILEDLGIEIKTTEKLVVK